MDFQQKVTELNEAKKQLKIAKDKEAKLVKEVKDEMMSTGVEVERVGNIKVTCQEVVKTSFDEDILVELVKELGYNECIETKEVVNEDKLQELIYKGFINIEAIQPAVKESKTYRLSVKEVK